MKIKRKSLVTKRVHTRDIDIDPAQLYCCEKHNYSDIDQRFPQLTEDEKEFIMSGVTPEEWKFLEETATGVTK